MRSEGFRLRRAFKNNSSALPGGVIGAGPAARLFPFFERCFFLPLNVSLRP